MKWELHKLPSVSEQLSSLVKRGQAVRRQGLLKLLHCLRYLVRQGLAIRGHTEVEGNLYQLLILLSAFDSDVKNFLSANKYLSHDFINELISMMCQSMLRSLIQKICACSRSWYSVIGDEATDTSYKEQFNISIRWVDEAYEIHEDPVGLFNLPNTTSETLFTVVKDILIRCSLPLSLCRGQAFDGAANMLGKRSGLVTRIRQEIPSALPVHCLAHSLNLCLQDAGRQLPFIRDALDTVKEIAKLIKISAKRSHLFSEKLAQPDISGVSIKRLCPTRWTARTGAIEAVLKDYSVLMETLEEVNRTTRDEYGLKAGGLLAALDKFQTLFGLKRGHLIFGASETLSKSLQGKKYLSSRGSSSSTSCKVFL